MANVKLDILDGFSLVWVLMYRHSKPGGVLSPKSYVDVPAGPRKSDYLYTNFLPNFPPISIPFSKEKHPIWIKLGAFYNNLPKIHPIYVIWAPSSLMKPPDRYTKFREKVPQKAGTYTYTMSMWEPPPPRIQSPRFYKWLTILNWNKLILVIDILTQILLTLLTFIALLTLQIVSICRWWVLFGVSYYINVSFTPWRVNNG